eukprot:CAMPEP_0181429528 /NCGR_PEP_ID=MMETSP1110-20121109/17248_1 /TAXON_ID=174948 /ORGANISM="Symbiodinium sp., Strain CCMP421" /LENGTH=527 /DNA_ID=CAMNT_0023552803 /DNA_START=60 /DNA_END=1643 /DNA_ORIENTATION=+
MTMAGCNGPRGVLRSAGLSMLSHVESSPRLTSSPQASPRPQGSRRPSTASRASEIVVVKNMTDGHDSKPLQSPTRRPSARSHDLSSPGRAPYAETPKHDCLAVPQPTAKRRPSTCSTGALMGKAFTDGHDAKTLLAPQRAEDSPASSAARASSASGPVVRRRAQLRRAVTIDSKIQSLMDSSEIGQFLEEQHPAATGLPQKVASLCGRVTSKDQFKPYFSGKSVGYSQLSQFNEMPHTIGVHCQRGQKPDSPNQDDFWILQTQDWLLCGVADGHGSNGHFVSHYVQEHLPQAVVRHLRDSKFDWRTSVSSAFSEVQINMAEHIPDKAFESGSTASVVLLAKDGPGWKLHTGFVGDSVVLYAKKASNAANFELDMVTSTHRPDRQDEMKRISKSNGQVIQSEDPTSPSRLRVPSGDMAMSRAFGDIDAHLYGLSSEPEFPEERVMQAGDEHLIILCSDGVWDMLNPREAVQICSKFPAEDAQRAAERLCAKAQSRWQQEVESGAIDDITAIVIRCGGDASARVKASHP